MMKLWAIYSQMVRPYTGKEHLEEIVVAEDKPASTIYGDIVRDSREFDLAQWIKDVEFKLNQLAPRVGD